MAKITYIFGAGASYGALPIVDEIPEKLKMLIDSFQRPNLWLSDSETFPEYDGVKLPLSKMNYLRNLLTDLNWMYNESKMHASVDTYAKKLYLKGDSVSLKRLKIALSTFFVFEQTINKVNERYDPFFAAILNNEMKIPENIKILSWNYDYQFEKAYSGYINVFDVCDLQERLEVHSKNLLHSNEFSIYKLNGTTSFYNGMPRGGFSFINGVNDQLTLPVIEQITHSYALIANHTKYWQTLSFAWERDYADPNFKEKIVSQIEDSAALVVIGYSFPFFNREIDRAIIGKLPFLRHFYIQSPDSLEISERFAAVNPDFDRNKIVPITNLKQFYLPSEL